MLNSNKSVHPTLNIPPVSVKLTEVDSVLMVFDVVRKKHLVLTAEEWVRQHFLNFMIDYLGYSKSLIKTESGLTVGKERQKRSDIVVFDSNGTPILLVECKSYEVKIDEQVLQQAIHYNQTYQSPTLVLTNGLSHYCFRWDNKKSGYVQIKEIPAFKNLNP